MSHQRHRRPHVPDHPPSGEGILFANVRGENLNYTRARLRPADKGKGVGGLGDGETRTFPLQAYHTYRIVNVPADAGSLTVELELTRGDSRTGEVIGPDGKPVLGARCYGLTAQHAQITTLAAAVFEVHGLERGHPRQLIFAHEGLRLVGSAIVKDDDLKSDAPLVVRLERPGALKGRLIDEDGQALAGARLSVLTLDLDGDNLPPGPSGLWPDNATVTTGADGRFEIVGLKPGVKCMIGVRDANRPNVRLDTGGVFRDVATRPGAVRDLGDVRVKPAVE